MHRENLSLLFQTLPENVTLVAVSKFHSKEKIMEAYSMGQRIFAESRVQELLLKQAELSKDICWHMIGHLQTNKVRSIVPFISLIQSVDSRHLLECIDREAKMVQRRISCLLEVSVTGEKNKTGWDAENLLEYARAGEWKNLQNIEFSGLMGMATLTDDETLIRKDFKRIHDVFIELKDSFGAQFKTLSMGMTDDYHIALSEGSNMVRIGSFIFGPREY